MHSCLRTLAPRAARYSLIAGLSLLACAGTQAQSVPLNVVHTIATADSATPIEHDFAISTAGTYTVKLTDLGTQMTPSMPVLSVKLAVTQGATVVKTLAAPGSVAFAATANTTYTLRVVGTPNATVNSSPIGEDVVAADGTTSIFSSIDALALPVQKSSNNTGVLNDSFTVSSTGNYTIALTDLQFPNSLSPLILALVPSGQTQIATLPDPTTSALQTTVQLQQGTTYRIIAVGKQPDSTAAGGLFSVSVTPSPGTTSVYSKTIPIGAVTLLATPSMVGGTFNLSAGTATLGLSDLQFPAILSQLGAVVVDSNGQAPAKLTAAGNPTFTVSSAGTYQAFAFGTAAASPGVGSYAVQVQQSGAAALSVARAVSTPTSGLTPYSFDASLAGSGAYVVTLTDFQFPAALTSAKLAAIQGGALLGSVSAAGNNFSITASQASPLTLLAFAQPTTADGGLLGIDVSTSGGGTSVLDVTQGVGVAFKATPLNISSTQILEVTATDLVFPAALSKFSVAVTKGTTLVGSVFASGSSATFPIQATAGIYVVNLVAQPDTTSKAGTYGLSVTPPPVVTLTADKTGITSGGSVNLTWSTQNATSCTASGGSGWTGAKDPNGGTTATAALTSTTTFTLSCTGSATTTSSVTVKVDPPASSGGGGGGGAIDLELLLALGALVAMRARGGSISGIVTRDH